MDTQAVIQDFLEQDKKYKKQHERIIKKIYQFNQDFLYITAKELSDILINDLKLDKFNTLNIYLSVLTQLFEYAVNNQYLKTNICKEADLSRTVLSREIARNIILVTDDILEKAIAGKENRIYIETANRLIYDGAAANWSGLGDIHWTDISTFFWTVNDVRVSQKTIALLKQMKEVREWRYYHGTKSAELTKPTDNHVFGYYHMTETTELTDSVIMRQMIRFIKDNCILYHGDYKLDPQKLYCSGVTDRVVRKYGVDFFVENFAGSIRDLHYVEQVIREYGLKIKADVLKKNLLPYGMKIKYNL